MPAGRLRRRGEAPAAGGGGRGSAAQHVPRWLRGRRKAGGVKSLGVLGPRGMAEALDIKSGVMKDTGSCKRDSFFLQQAMGAIASC
jgi:hypothetical protein